MPQLPWTQRTFDFDFPAGLYPELIERVRGAPVRARALCEGLLADVLTRRDGERWSMQENIGHLADTDLSLFIGRLDDFDANAEVLRPADMSNVATHEADHNARSFTDVIEEFRDRRDSIVQRLEVMSLDDFARTSCHPRLDTPMRLVDLVYFKAEHDDYHLARVRALRRQFAGR